MRKERSKQRGTRQRSAFEDRVPETAGRLVWREQRWPWWMKRLQRQQRESGLRDLHSPRYAFPSV